MKKILKKHLASNLVELFNLQIELRANDLAAICGNDSISYEKLNQKANQLAHYLLELGVKEETQIAIAMERSIDFLVLILGILKAGAAYVPLDPSYPEERLLSLLNENQIPLLITMKEKIEKFNGYEGKIIAFDEDKRLLRQNKTNPQIKIKAGQLAYIIYTSGSTGKPKGVLIEHQSIVNYTRWFADYSGLKAQQRIDFSANCSFDFAVTTSIVPLLLGLTVVICDQETKKDPLLYLNYIDENKIDLIKITPGYFNVLIGHVKIQPASLRHLKKIVLGGENLYSKDCASWLALYPSHILFNEYGPTETSVAVSVKRIDRKNVKSLNRQVPIGTLIPDCFAYILNEKGNLVGKGEMGELYLGGLCLARGYFNNEELTQRAFIKNRVNLKQPVRLYKTGDVCRFLPTGELECHGRIDEQIKIRGFRVELSEIENCLAAHPALKSVIVNATENHHQEKRLTAYYILEELAPRVSKKELSSYLQRYLPDFMIPATFIRMESFPFMANGKIDRKALSLLAPCEQMEYIAPKTDTEKTLAKIWADELGVERVGINDNFFEQGGHSLSAARITTTINHVLAKELSLQSFYQYPTVSALATVLDNMQKVSGSRELSKEIYEKSRRLPLSGFQFTLWLSHIFESKARNLTIFSSRRFNRHFEEKRLCFAFNKLLKKHEVLTYKVSIFHPTQYTDNLAFEIGIKNLAPLSPEAAGMVLENSLDELRRLRSWPRQYSALIARSFYLAEGWMEVQLCMPHILSDEISLDILFNDLIHFYHQQDFQQIEEDKAYREYLFSEKAYVEKHINHDLIFWQNYLKDSSLFAIPANSIVPNMRRSNLPYSHYTEIPEELLENSQKFCANNLLSIDDGLSAILLLALSNCCGENNLNIPICFSKVKSTRDSSRYDRTVGCFLNIELVKLMLNKQQNLISIAQQIHASFIKTSPYQRCSALIKLASISNFSNPKKIKEKLINLFISIYNFLSFSYKINKEIIILGSRLSNPKKNSFLINVNIHNSFLKPKSEPNFSSQQITSVQYNLLEIDNILDVCFLRMPNQKHYMVISANLTADFHDLLRKEVLKLLKDKTRELDCS